MAVNNQGSLRAATPCSPITRHPSPPLPLQAGQGAGDRRPAGREAAPHIRPVLSGIAPAPRRSERGGGASPRQRRLRGDDLEQKDPRFDDAAPLERGAPSAPRLVRTAGYLSPPASRHPGASHSRAKGEADRHRRRRPEADHCDGGPPRRHCRATGWRGPGHGPPVRKDPWGLGRAAGHGRLARSAEADAERIFEDVGAHGRGHLDVVRPGRHGL